MRLRIVLPLALATLAVTPVLVTGVGLSVLARVKDPAGVAIQQVGWWMALGLGVGLLLFVVALALLQLLLVRPMEDLAREARALARTPQSRCVDVPQRHLLGQLPECVQELHGKIQATRSETAGAIDEAVTRAEAQRSRLEAILLDLTEGVIVCNIEHRILLYNRSAARILGMREMLGLGRSVLELLTAEPILHALEQLLPSGTAAQAAAGGAEAAPGAEDPQVRRFVCASIDMATLLESRMSLVREPTGRVSGYVLTFAEVGTELEDIARRDEILREVMVEWRRPLASLRAAAEMLATSAELTASERNAFEEIIFKEVESLNLRFAEASRRHDRISAGPWPMADIYSLDLFRSIARHLSESDGIKLTLVGVPAWLHADSHSLMLALEHLVRATAKAMDTLEFDIEAEQKDDYVYVEVSWDGAPIASATIDAWLAEPLKGTIGNRTGAQIVERHGSELWSKPQREGRSCLRLPLRAARQAGGPKAARSLAPRPEYYDFDLFTLSHSALEEMALKHLNFVVFDTETTGLRPSEGDELISIGAVRVVNGRILTGESFERLINPGRPIPGTSIRFHGITDEMVKDKPPARVVLPHFKSFVGDAVLVAYNAAFDMKFLELKCDESGVQFGNPVLDALLLMIHLHSDAPDHSLSAMAARFGIETVGRHTALGDAMITAALWVRLIDLLENDGIRTFGDAIKLSSRLMAERKQLLQF